MGWLHMLVKILVVVGGINWGLVGVSMLMGSATQWNVVNMLLGGMPVLEGVVYLLVGVSAIMMLCGCKCSKTCASECSANPSTPTQSM
ncbi:MAG: DUF378 domain-containing protein [Candidatus Pacebacteria bacterium]|nr:DUF378 domain-containing protein [Candidatus Paceibacterota bacterium]MCF7862967.1 DUF378 domain-containing protein [Candidatus Paceibacterota bacterium]